METLDYSNEQFQIAAEFVQFTREHVFLTGKAGTGKTTFLKYIKDKCGKKYILTAPTGVAAINAGGVTLHSFFQLPLGLFIANYRKNWGEEDQQIVNKHQLLANIRLSGKKRNLIRELELLIIDEISMVRADLLDAVDAILRHIRRRPDEAFGGVQLLMIGDLYQLPPVVRNNELALMSEHYNSPFFFDAHCLKEQNPINIELQRIYRQEDPVFIQILNNIRNNEMTEEDFLLLQERYFLGFLPGIHDGVITLTSHNAQAWEINQNNLENIPAKSFVLKAKVKGLFPESAFPMEPDLELKEGAQVMFIKNDSGENRRYYNGKIGIVEAINTADNEIKIYFPKEKESITIGPDSWENIRFNLNEKTNKIEEDVKGTFTQFPIRLAWAVTIHKSQGLTFDEAVIDAGRSFAPGQVYVALSRLTSIKGMMLRSKITPSSIKVDERIVAFMNEKKNAESRHQTLALGKTEFLFQKLIQSFQWQSMIHKWDGFLETAISVQTQDLIMGNEVYRTAMNHLMKLKKVGLDFGIEIRNLFQQKEWASLANRIEAGQKWMDGLCKQNILEPFQFWYEELKVSKGGKKAADTLSFLAYQIAIQQKEMFKSAQTTKMLGEGKEITEALTAFQEDASVPHPFAKGYASKTSTAKPVKQSSAEISLELFQEVKSVEAVAEKRNMVVGTILGHLIKFIPEGKIKAEDLVSPQKLLSVLEVIHQNPTYKLGELKSALGDACTYDDIRIALAHHKLMSPSEVETDKK